MILSFTLTMPNRGSWNGKWSGENNLYAITKTFTSKKDKEKAASLLEQSSFYYRWDDGWGANIEVKEINTQEARRIRRASKGFCGYGWMVDSILMYGQIKTDEEIRKAHASK